MVLQALLHDRLKGHLTVIWDGAPIHRYTRHQGLPAGATLERPYGCHLERLPAPYRALTAQPR